MKTQNQKNTSSKKEISENVQKKNSENIICPNCKLNVAMILDYKKITDRKSDWICLICGNIFEHEITY